MATTRGPAADAASCSETIKYEVIGGDAFRDDKITVQADGSARSRPAGDAHRQADRRRALSPRARGRDADLAKVESETTDPPQPDALSYRFTYRGRQVETDRARCRTSCAP